MGLLEKDHPRVGDVYVWRRHKLSALPFTLCLVLEVHGEGVMFLQRKLSLSGKLKWVKVFEQLTWIDDTPRRGWGYIRVREGEG